MSIQIMQKARQVGIRRWDWSVWLAGPKEELDQIIQVTYTLHPTFPNPVRKKRTRENGFLLKSNCWGEFRIYMDIKRKDGSHEQISHYLRLTSGNVKEYSPTEDVAKQGSVRHEVDLPAFTAASLGLVPHRSISTETEYQQTPIIFISGRIVDAQIIDLLSDVLIKFKASVLRIDDDITFGVPFQVHLNNMIAHADLVVILISGRSSLWMEQEITIAKRHEKRILPVMIGQENELPPSLYDIQYLQLEKSDDIYDLARQIIGMIPHAALSGIIHEDSKLQESIQISVSPDFCQRVSSISHATEPVPNPTA